MRSHYLLLRLTLPSGPMPRKADLRLASSLDDASTRHDSSAVAVWMQILRRNRIVVAAGSRFMVVGCSYTLGARMAAGCGCVRLGLCLVMDGDQV